MYVRAISTRFCRGRSTPAIRAILLPLPLLVLLVAADDAHDALPAHDLALDADLPDRRAYFHWVSRHSKTLDLTTESAGFRSASARCGPGPCRRAGAPPPPLPRAGCASGRPPPRR